MTPAEALALLASVDDPHVVEAGRVLAESIDEDALQLRLCLDACGIPSAYGDGESATLADRLRALAEAHGHAVLLAKIAGYRLDEDGPTKPLKDGDKMPVALAWCCQHFAATIDAVPGAKNYLSFGFTDANGRSFTVTIQRAEGKTPAEIATSAERAAVVAWLRERADTLAPSIRPDSRSTALDAAADSIERGAHREGE